MIKVGNIDQYCFQLTVTNRIALIVNNPKHSKKHASVLNKQTYSKYMKILRNRCCEIYSQAQ